MSTSADASSYPFRIQDPRPKTAISRLLELTAATGKLQKDVADALQELSRHLAGDTYGGTESLQRERQTLQQRMEGFDRTRSPSYRAFHDRGLTERRFPEIVSICEVLVDDAGIVPMDRECKRRKPVLWAWLDSHWAQLEPRLCRIKLVFADGDEQFL
jgi:hypothetical protein